MNHQHATARQEEEHASTSAAALTGSLQPRSTDDILAGILARMAMARTGSNSTTATALTPTQSRRYGRSTSDPAAQRGSVGRSNVTRSSSSSNRSSNASKAPEQMMQPLCLKVRVMQPPTGTPALGSAAATSIPGLSRPSESAGHGINQTTSSSSSRSNTSSRATSRCSSSITTGSSTADSLLALQLLAGAAPPACAADDCCSLPAVRGHSASLSRTTSLSSSTTGRHSSHQQDGGSSAAGSKQQGASAPAAKAGSMRRTSSSIKAPVPRLAKQSSSSTKQGQGPAAAPACHPLAVPSDPAAWLPWQHPAVATALKTDLATFAATEAAAGAAAGHSGSDSPAATAWLLPPAFPGTAPTLAFSVGQQHSDTGPANQQAQQQLVPLRHAKLLVRYTGVAASTVKQVFKASGFRRTKGSGWTVLWGSLAPPELLAGLTGMQKHNHFPGTWELGRKDRLYRNIAAAARRTRGSGAFGFVPKFFLLPGDLPELAARLAQQPGLMLIRKPAASSRGRGVALLPNPGALLAAAQASPAAAAGLVDVVLQQYVADPLLIGGRKWDMRVYVAVTSLDPLRVYVYHEGLVRFACEQYSTARSCLGRATMHLTNYSINKQAPGFKQPGAGAGAAAASDGGPPKAAAAAATAAVPLEQQQQQQQHGKASAAAVDGGAEGCSAAADADFAACKWSFRQLQHHFQQQGLDWQGVWEQVCTIAVQTIIAAEPGLVSSVRSCSSINPGSFFEQFGFDVLLDSSLRAWLLEVNTCPSLSADSALDQQLKTQLLADLLTLVGVTPCDASTMQQCQAAQRQERLTGLTTNGGTDGGSSSGGSSSGCRSVAGDRAAGQGTAVGGSQAAPPRKPGSTSVTAVRALSAVQQLDSVPALQLPEAVRQTEAEWQRCLRQGQRWQCVFPCRADPARQQQCMQLFETPRVSDGLVARYCREQQQLQQRRH